MATFAILGAAIVPAAQARYVWYPSMQQSQQQPPQINPNEHHIINLGQSFSNAPPTDSTKPHDTSTSKDPVTSADPKTSHAPPPPPASSSGPPPKPTSSAAPPPPHSSVGPAPTATSAPPFGPSSSLLLTPSASASASASSSASAVPNSSGGVSSGAVAGIVIAALAIAGAVAAFVMIRRKNRRTARAQRMQDDPFTMGFGSQNPPPASNAYNNNANNMFQSPPPAHMSPYSNMTSAHTLSPPMADAAPYKPQEYYPATNNMEKTEAYAMAPMQSPPMEQHYQAQQQQPMYDQQHMDYQQPITQPHMDTAAAAAVPMDNASAPATNGGSLGVYAVVATYTPTLSDEIDIQLGDQVELVVEYDDGWCQGINLTRGSAKGVFPRHCIEQYPGQQAPQTVSDHPPQVELSSLKRVSSMYMAYN